MTFDFDAFLSYAHTDIDFVRQLATWLRRCGLRVWFAEEQLVPGTRFRSGLQQGLRESRHLIAVLTDSYINRAWTQRELDLFDLSASLDDRRILALEINDVNLGLLDQAFQVHQRIRWQDYTFDAEAFWQLHCGLRNRPPGPRSRWMNSGTGLLQNAGDHERSADSAPPKPTARDGDVDIPPIWLGEVGFDDELTNLVSRVLIDPDESWLGAFNELQAAMRRRSDFGPVEQEIIRLWAFGHCQPAAVLVLASEMVNTNYYAPWALLDSGLFGAARYHLLVRSLYASPSNESDDAEIWFSWAVAEGAWRLLEAAALRAPQEPQRPHFKSIAKMAETPRDFDSVEEQYDYGVMITPWNHFHLCWLALRHGAADSARAHWAALCKAAPDDLRVGRFLNRLSGWPVFRALRSRGDAEQELDCARVALGLLPHPLFCERRHRLRDVWYRCVAE